MYGLDEEHVAFLNILSVIFYKVMPFELKNVVATYRRLVNKMFTDQIGKILEEHIDNIFF